jgi:hypothetical protein
MAQLYNPLQKPSQATAKQLSVYLDGVSWASDTNLLTLSVGLLSDAADLTIMGLRLHYDGGKVSYTADTDYSLTPSQGTDIAGQGIDNILTSGKITATGHVEISDTTSDYDSSADTTHFIKTNWTTNYASNPQSNFPGATDVKLYEISFTVTDTSSPISFGLSAESNELKEGYSLSSTSENGFSIDLTLVTDAGAQAITIGHTDSSNTRTLFDDQSLVFVSSETENTTVAMSSGSLDTLSQNLSFTHVELSNSSYDHGISISDVVLQLRDIVGLSSLEGKQKIAADIDRNDEVTISDVVSNLRHIVGLDTIEECALVDSSDQLVTSLTTLTVADLTLVQYGDVDLSATFLIA